MWSLPDISRLNAEAETNAKVFEKELKKKSNGVCDDCNKKAVEKIPYYDIFSEDIKGINKVCDRHRDSLSENYFYCDGCDRTFINNYTWELYFHDTEDGERLCLPCLAQRIIADHDKEHWIELNPDNINAIDWERVRQAPHCIAVKMPTPKGIKTFGSCTTFDSMSGGRVTSFSSADSTPDSGVDELKHTLHSAWCDGYKRALLIMDGAYQFAVDIQVYVDDVEVKPLKLF